MTVRVKGRPPVLGEKRSVLYTRGCMLIPLGGLVAMVIGLLAFAAISSYCI